jgi:hypothetical protein
MKHFAPAYPNKLIQIGQDQPYDQQKENHLRQFLKNFTTMIEIRDSKDIVRIDFRFIDNERSAPKKSPLDD